MFPGSKKKLILFSDDRSIILVELVSKRKSLPACKTLAAVDGKLLNPDDLQKLVGSLDKVRGEISLSLPLVQFENISLSLPNMPEGSLGRAIPFHLSKNLSKPITDYIFDWQVTRRQKDQMQVEAYLFPKKDFDNVQKVFAEKKMKVQLFEIDVFSAFSFLSQENRLKPSEPALAVLLWPDSISLGVCENSKVVMSRTVHLQQPQTPYGISDEDVEEIQEEVLEDFELVAAEEESLSPDSDVDSILNGFELFGGGESEDALIAEPQLEPVPELELSIDDGSDLGIEFPAATEQPSSSLSSWDEYLQQVSLEIMRTRDYFSSIMKGETVRKIYVNGAQAFWDDLANNTKESLQLDIEPLNVADLEADIPASLAAICIGIGR